MRCASPLAFGTLVDYFAGDLSPSEADGVEEHLFGCAACSQAAERVARVAGALRGATPPVVSAAQVAEMRASGCRVVEGTFAPGERREAVFAPDVDLLVHHLGGLTLGEAERVEVVVRTESGAVLAEEPYAPFEREAGEVLIACQRHFASMPPDVVFEVHVHGPEEARTSHVYHLPHVFVARPGEAPAR